MEEEGGHRTPWTAADDASLLAGVVAFWRVAPCRLPWASISAMLPSRSRFACEQRARALRLAGPAAPACEEGAGGGCAGSQWSVHEDATLLGALSLRCSPMEVKLTWQAVREGAPALAGRTVGSLQGRWGQISQSPAALAAAAQVAAEGAQRSAARAPLPPPLPPPRAPPPQAPALSPFHMLHSLRSAGSIDEATLRVCWRAAAEACGRA